MKKLFLLFLILLIAGCPAGQVKLAHRSKANYKKEYSKNREKAYAVRKVDDQKGDSSFFYEKRKNYEDGGISKSIESKKEASKSYSVSDSNSDKKHHDVLLNEALNKNSILSALAVKENQVSKKKKDYQVVENATKTKAEDCLDKKEDEKNSKDTTDKENKNDKKKKRIRNKKEASDVLNSNNNDETFKDSEIKKNNSNRSISENKNDKKKKRIRNKKEASDVLNSNNNDETFKDSEIKKNNSNRSISENTDVSITKDESSNKNKEAIKTDIKDNKIIKKTYRIQCGNYTNEKVAKELADKIKNSGIDDVSVVSENGVNKIFVGSFATKEDGASVRDALKKLDFIKNEFWVYK